MSNFSWHVDSNFCHAVIMLTIFPCKYFFFTSYKTSEIMSSMSVLWANQSCPARRKNQWSYAWVNFPACGKENWSVQASGLTCGETGWWWSGASDPGRQRKQPPPKQCWGSIGLALVYKNYTSKVVRYWYEIHLESVFKQVSSNFNLKFLSETLPRFPACQKESFP